MKNLARIICDAILEHHINMAAKSDLKLPGNWENLCTLIKQRSPEQVSRMERRKGLVI